MVNPSVRYLQVFGVVVIGLIPLGPRLTAAPPAPEQVELGRHLFTRTWEPALPGPESGDGLGPLFNGRSCAECHHQAGIGGGGSLSHNVQFIRPVVPGTESEPSFTQISRSTSRMHLGKSSSTVTMLHRFAVRSEYAVWRARQLAAQKHVDPDTVLTIGFPPGHPVVHVPYNEPPNGWTVARRLEHLLYYSPLMNPLTSPVVEGLRLRVDPLPGPSTAGPLRFGCGGCGSCYITYYEPRRFFEINTPPLFGLGLLEQITLADVQATAAAQPSRIRGRPAIFPDGRLGRFGWKAQHASLRDFNDEACAMELGLTTPRSRQAPLPKLHPTDDDPVPSLDPRSAGANPDISAAGVDALTAFVASLPQPRERVDTRRQLLAARWPDPAASGAASVDPGVPPSASASRSEQVDVRVGWYWFKSIGCAGCHTPDIGPVSGVYSDLLLHEVGTESDGGYFHRGHGEQMAGPGELRTPPLWGVADSGPYLHDGSAPTLETAIVAHAGQAEHSAKQFREKLSPNQRRQVIAFLNSLRAPHPN